MVGTALMPEGVEHFSKASRALSSTGMVGTALMPEGVEHFHLEDTGRAWPAEVGTALMPEGVEHPSPRRARRPNPMWEPL